MFWCYLEETYSSFWEKAAHCPLLEHSTLFLCCVTALLGVLQGCSAEKLMQQCSGIEPVATGSPIKGFYLNEYATGFISDKHSKLK